MLCPTRGRLPLLRRSFESLLQNADHPELIEFLAAVDPDDPGLEVQSWTGPSFRIWAAPERYGYGRLHEYYNALAARARGKWLMVWNDDAVMLTQGWDSVILENTCDQVLQPWHSDGGYSHNDFPVWPRAWSDTLGYAARIRFIDAEVTSIGRCLGRVRQVPVQIQHDRDPALIAAHLGTAEPGDLYDPATAQRFRDGAAKVAKIL